MTLLRDRLALLTVLCAFLLGVWVLTPASGAGDAGSLASDPTSLGPSTSAGPDGSSSTVPVDSSGTDGTTETTSATGPGDTIDPGALRATDIGVTADDITIGIGLIDFSGLAGAGFGVTVRGDEQQVAEAFVDDINARGGINGRSLEAHIYLVDPLDASKARAACLEATEQHRVFAYVDTLSQYTPAQQACLSIEHRTPLITPTPNGADVMKQAFPNQISPVQDDNRTMKGAAAILKRRGTFGGGFGKLGILDDTCQPAVNADLKRALAAAGVSSDRISEFTFDCDGNNVAGQATQAALAHKQAGVTDVIVATQYVQLQLYATAASSQLFAPRYLVTDLGGLTADISVASMDPTQFDGAIGITSSFSGATAAGRPLPALAQDCNRALRDHGLAPMQNLSGTDGVAAYLCETLTLFELLARRAGPVLTRAALTGALPSIGTFHGSYTETAIFDRPGKVSGGDTLAVIEWRRSCTCYHQVESHHPAGV